MTPTKKGKQPNSSEGLCSRRRNDGRSQTLPEERRWRSKKKKKWRKCVSREQCERKRKMKLVLTKKKKRA